MIIKGERFSVLHHVELELGQVVYKMSITKYTDFAMETKHLFWVFVSKSTQQNTLFWCSDCSDNWDQSCPCCCWFRLNGMLHLWSNEANIEIKHIQTSSCCSHKMLSLILWYLYHYFYKTEEDSLNVCSLLGKLLFCVCKCVSDCYGKL